MSIYLLCLNYSGILLNYSQIVHTAYDKGDCLGTLCKYELSIFLNSQQKECVGNCTIYYDYSKNDLTPKCTFDICDMVRKKCKSSTTCTDSFRYKSKRQLLKSICTSDEECHVELHCCNNICKCPFDKYWNRDNNITTQKDSTTIDSRFTDQSLNHQPNDLITAKVTTKVDTRSTGQPINHQPNDLWTPQGTSAGDTKSIDIPRMSAKSIKDISTKKDSTTVDSRLTDQSLNHHPNDIGTAGWSLSSTFVVIILAGSLASIFVAVLLVVLVFIVCRMHYFKKNQSCKISTQTGNYEEGWGNEQMNSPLNPEIHSNGAGNASPKSAVQITSDGAHSTTRTGFDMTNLRDSGYELAKPIEEEPEPKHGLTNEGVYNKAVGKRESEKNPNYSRCVDTVYDTSAHARKHVVNDGAYDHIFGKKPVNDYGEENTGKVNLVSTIQITNEGVYFTLDPTETGFDRTNLKDANQGMATPTECGTELQVGVSTERGNDKARGEGPV